jgi:lipopolysaccharide biosynthesis protein
MPILNETTQALLSVNDNKAIHEPNLAPIIPQKRRSNTAVIFHLYYPELWDDTLGYLDNLNKDFDFFVSIPENVIFNQDLILQKFPNALIYRCTNRGRDIASFLRLFSMITPLGYEYICKIHTKKSLHLNASTEWRTEILNELLGSDSLVKSIKQHLNDENVGIIGPKNHIVSTRYFLGDNQDLINELADRLDLGYSGEYFNYIAGSMFWFKPSAIAPILRLDLKDTDFPEESGQKDGTLAHALERIISLLAMKQGYQIIQTGTFTGEPHDEYYRFSKFQQKPLIRMAAWVDRQIPENGWINHFLQNLLASLSILKHQGLKILIRRTLNKKRPAWKRKKS